MNALRITRAFFGALGALVALVALVALGLVPSAFAAVPSNRNDPCAKGGRNTCDTLGVGYYKSYRYGTRWFGDFKGAVPGEAHTFCIDFRFWYPARMHRYRVLNSIGLRNKAGGVVSLEKRQRMAYAVWVYGQSQQPDQQAAVMLYVHSLMGDARPGEVDPAALNSRAAALYARIAREASLYHGPYKVEIKRNGAKNATLRVLSARGKPLPKVQLRLSTGKTVRTSAAGVAGVTMPSTSFSVTTGALPASLPKIYGATTALAAANSQRLVAPSSQTLRANVRVIRQVKAEPITVTTAATPARLAVGETSTDRVTLANAPATWTGTVAVRIYGPYPAQSAITCTGTPVWQTTFTASGSVFSTPGATLSQAGWYAYQLDVAGMTTPCPLAIESFRVETQPKIATTISADRVATGTPVFDRVLVTGLGGQRATVKAALYGPYPTREAMTCAGTPLWTGTIDAQLDGEYQTAPVTLTAPGFYTYREWIDATELVRAVQTACGEATETTVVIARPQIKTQISAQQVRPGAKLTDKVIVTGLGGQSAPIKVELWGPFPTREAIRCTGTPAWTGSFVAKGDGTYTTEPVTVAKVGYYTYVEAIVAAQAYEGFATLCGEAAETALVRAEPTVTTEVSDDVVGPGATIFDRVRVEGLGQTSATIEVELFGPFGSYAGLRCDDTPFWSGKVTATGDGMINTPPVKITEAGFYTYRERLVGSALVAEFRTECGLVPETSLIAPAILAGRGDKAAHVRVAQTTDAAPVRVRVTSVGIDAAVSPVGIDIALGALGISSNIDRTSWWRDGTAPGSKTGAVLIAGHVDSAKSGAGAFYKLHSAKAGAQVQVTTAAGRTFTYRVVSIRNYLKRDIPTSIYSRKGDARLVLVTCGGPFEAASGHYRDNVVVTAVPL